MRPIDSKSYHILVVLAARPLHGYGIRQEVEERSEGTVRLWPATLYGTLADLAELGWIDETEGPGGADDDPRRRYYTLTAAGREALEAETARMESLARLARSRLREAT
jgi:DNA-binding PadR family transcriptional regulator